MAIAFDSSASGTGLGVTGHLSHTSSGSNRILFAFVCGASAAGLISSVTCNGVTMTRLINTGGVSGFSTVCFYLIGQPAGTVDIQYNWAADAGFYFSMWSTSYTGANALDGAAAATGPNSGTESVTVTTSLANSWVTASVFSGNSGFSTPTGYTNRVAEFSNLSGVQARADDSNGIVGVGANTVTWTWSGASAGGAIAIGVAAGSQPTNDNCIFFAGD